MLLKITNQRVVEFTFNGGYETWILIRNIDSNEVLLKIKNMDSLMRVFNLSLRECKECNNTIKKVLTNEELKKINIDQMNFLLRAFKEIAE